MIKNELMPETATELTPEELKKLEEKYNSSLTLIELSKESYESNISKEEMEKYQRDLYNHYRINEIIPDSLLNRSFNI
jgi:hypothetical protein